MKNLALIVALLGALLLAGCHPGGDPGDPNVGASTGAQPSSVGKLPVASKPSSTASTPAGNSFGRSR